MKVKVYGMNRLVLRIKHLIYHRLIPALAFRNSWRERMSRQEFFYNAFRVLSFNGIDGDYAEFGSCGGKTFALAYHYSRRQGHQVKLWSFDSFQGLPATQESKDKHLRWVAESMATSLDEFHAICNTNGIPRDAYCVVPGFYEQTLAKMLPENPPENICLAYIDCDLYSSTKVVLEFLLPRIKHGMIIAFDDYFCWSKSQISGERMAMLELLSKNKRWKLVPYMHFGWHGLAFVVENRSID